MNSSKYRVRGIGAAEWLCYDWKQEVIPVTNEELLQMYVNKVGEERSAIRQDQRARRIEENGNRVPGSAQVHSSTVAAAAISGLSVTLV